MAWIGGSVGGAVAAAAEQERQRKEEQELVEMLHSEDSEGRYEYKILRSYGHAFGNNTKMQAALEQEAPAGWEMAVKLDNGRLMLRRQRSMRQTDSLLPQGVDPYRVYTGANTPLVIGLVLGLVMLMLFVVLGLGMITSSFKIPMIMIAIMVAVLGAVVIAIKARR